MVLAIAVLFLPVFTPIASADFISIYVTLAASGMHPPGTVDAVADEVHDTITMLYGHLIHAERRGVNARSKVGWKYKWPPARNAKSGAHTP